MSAIYHTVAWVKPLGQDTAQDSELAESIHSSISTNPTSASSSTSSSSSPSSSSSTNSHYLTPTRPPTSTKTSSRRQSAVVGSGGSSEQPSFRSTHGEGKTAESARAGVGHSRSTTNEQSNNETVASAPPFAFISRLTSRATAAPSPSSTYQDKKRGDGEMKEEPKKAKRGFFF